MTGRILKLVAALAILSQASLGYAQQPAQTQQQPALTGQPLVQGGATPVQAPAAAVDARDTARSLKPSLAVPHELSPWSMFLSADIL
ncbi:MAG: tonB-system energizer ExbB, partial [Gemmatimonas sp.]